MGHFVKSGDACAVLSAAALGAFLFPAGPAQAQRPASGTPVVGKPAANGPGLGEIVVTAQKRSENLQKSPIAITAIDSSRIEQAGLQGPAQLQFTVPSLTFGELNGSTYVTVRGLGADQAAPAESSVATYLDGVYTGVLLAQSVPTFDLKRIEVLRGPQGTLYGRNTTGGVINYITNPPSFEPGVNASVSYGNYNAVQGDIGVTGPLVADKIAARLNFHYGDHDGYGYNIALGKREYADRVYSGRGAILINPSSHLSITLRGDVTHEKSSPAFYLISTHSLDGVASPQTPLGVFSLPASALAGYLSPSDIAKLGGGSIASYYGLGQPGVSPINVTESRNFVNSTPSIYKTDVRGVSGTLDWNVGSAAIKSITAYRYYKLASSYDVAGFGTPELLIDPTRQVSKQFTQELNVSGEALNGRLNWLGGAFYFRDSNQTYSNIWFVGNGDYYTALVNLSNAPGSPYPFNLNPTSLASLNSLLPPSPLQSVVLDGPDISGSGDLKAFSSIPASGGSISVGGTQVSQSVAGFAQATYKISDSLRLTGGFRLTNDNKRAVRSVHSNYLYTIGALFGFDPGLCTKVHQSKSWTAPTGTVGLDYDVGQHILAYGKISWGYKGGGANFGACTGIYNPEYLTSYESGIKAIFADGQILTNAAMYYYDYKAIQFTSFNPNGSGILNAGSATAFGVELEYAIRPRELPGFQIDGSASFEDSQYGPGCFADPSALNGASALNPANPAECPAKNPLGNPVLASAQIKGNELVRAPRWKTNFGAQYTAELGDAGTVTLRGEGAWSDKYYNDIWNGKAPFLAANTQPAYWIANLSLVWTAANKRYQAQLFGNNLTNTLYNTSRVGFNIPSTLVSVAGHFGPPRTFGARLTVKLGSALN